uniref:EF-hand domain-containing protein n=1 Tax=Timspurckia oligopyrenoides TaxID=708627 RepID=A0A7S0ZCC5_9RHOD|mmetsp:Transcript_12329/g.22290  ORF Transcript_12329/g.22290 Transcript_12329/m.22290 type:complete len:198 (+) Transcript_12329:57-650(+)|eukprot:CAMPEP_0182441206 /NCGR_PEP_ID=MMETSP1172-20130603/155_1 /TAXON_ID=708627 /ORGANISM="Timspurckia oligopyrenoides, Strain CCMP3278" /LENGTH=197 /DNA_ID=CAMNT_0024635373 /DNA_START=33 /DNA_END=626 /DNA_ORIENTATION=-
MVDIGGLILEELNVRDRTEDDEDEYSDEDSESGLDSGVIGVGSGRMGWLSVDDLTLLSPSAERDALNAFQLNDTDNDGLISAAECIQTLNQLGFESGDIIEGLRHQGAAKIDMDDFVCVLRALIRASDPSDDETRIRNAFKHVDADGNGVLDVDEFLLLLKMLGKKMSKEDAEELFRKIDKDHSGTIDFDEFVDSVF